MKIKLFILVLTMIIIATSVYSAKIATLYSDFMDRGYKNTLVSELTEAGFEVVPYENIYFKDLISNINDYEMLICVPTFNYSNSVQIENYKNELSKYVEEGGIIIVSDQNFAGDDLRDPFESRRFVYKFPIPVIPKVRDFLLINIEEYNQRVERCHFDIVKKQFFHDHFLVGNFLMSP